MTKANFTNGDRISFYHLQPIPRKDMKTSWIDNRPLSIYGWKRITGEVRQSHASHNRLWVKDNVVFEEEAEGSEMYIYLEDVDKGHPLYFGGGCILPERTLKTA